MVNKDFTTTILVNQSPKQVFNAINNPRGWWTEDIEGDTEKLNDIFIHRYKDIHITKLKLIEVTPFEKVQWLVLENYFSFTKDKSEWVSTKIVFEISEKEKETQLKFTHKGLVPNYECYDICVNAWTNFVQNSLKDLITKGIGKPNKKES